MPRRRSCATDEWDFVPDDDKEYDVSAVDPGVSSSVARPTRLLNLVAALLATPQHLTAEQIRESVNGYERSGAKETFLRMFERDKDHLRNLGIPISTKDSLLEPGVIGYKIDSSEYEIGDITLNKEEATAIAMATTLWQSPSQRTHTLNAVKKLRLAGVDIDTFDYVEGEASRLSHLTQSVGSEENLAAILEAIDLGVVMSFPYRPASTGVEEIREVEPWRVYNEGSSWYVTGWDLAREAQRSYKLSRIFGTVEITATPRTQKPLLQKTTTSVADATFTAQVWIAEGSAAGLIRSLDRAGVRLEARDFSYRGKPGQLWTIHRVREEHLIQEILTRPAEVVACEPLALRHTIAQRIQELMAEILPSARVEEDQHG